MAVRREELYQQVWAEPMTKVSARHEVSGNYLARVCEYLNVPRPPRGYWARLSAGKAPKRPPLPDARPGEVLEWSKGDSVPDPPKPPPKIDAEPVDATATPSSDKRQPRHELVAGVREYFESCRLSEEGYLRPYKRNLVDVFVSKDTLAYCVFHAS
jgi:hypothetical protein